MAREDNLTHKLSVEEQRRGGQKSGETRRKKKLLRELAEMAINREITNNATGELVTVGEAMILKQIEKAMKGDTRAFQCVRDTAGQAPVQQIEMGALVTEQARFTELLEQYGYEAGK